MSDEAEWYYTRNGKEIGPLNLNELRSQLSKIVDWGHIYVWHPRMIDEWMPAEAVPELTRRNLPRRPKPPLAPNAASGWPTSHVIILFAGIVSLMVLVGFFALSK